jgi:arylsulfatase A-like enzyme
MKTTLKLALLTALSLTAVACSDNNNHQQKPNIPFIAIDDLNTSPELMNGETSVHTPNLSRLAKKGNLFQNARVGV